jgi:hypothetical protein
MEARFSAPVQTGPGAHPASCTMGSGSFPGVKSGRGVTMTPHPLLVTWSWKGRAVPLLPLWAVRPLQSLSTCTRVHFTFFTEKKKILSNCSQIPEYQTQDHQNPILSTTTFGTYSNVASELIVKLSKFLYTKTVDKIPHPLPCKNPWLSCKKTVTAPSGLDLPSQVCLISSKHKTRLVKDYRIIHDRKNVSDIVLIYIQPCDKF